MHQRSTRGGSRRFAGLGLGTVLVGMLLALLLGVVVPSAAGASEADDYVARINGLRSSVGVQPLGVDGELTAAAQACANRIAAQGALIHSSSLSSGISSHWTKLGENIGMGPANAAVWTAFLHSSQHYANLVDPAFNRVGVGVAYGGGSQWTCHRFMAASGGGGQPAAARTPAPRAARPAPAPRASAPAAPAPSVDPVPLAPLVVTPPPMPGPPPPADAARVYAVLHALHELTPDPPAPAGPATAADSARVSAVLHALHALTGGPTPVGGS